MKLPVALAFLALLSVVSSARSQTPAEQKPSAAKQMAQPGPEEKWLHPLAGSWDVVATLWPSPGAQPMIARGLVAERTMIGPILQEIMQPAPGSQVPDFRRLDYLNFDRVEGRWKYVSMDTRFPVSIMPAWSSGPAAGGKVTVQFAPQAFVGFGPEVTGQLMLSDMQISSPDADHVLKEQKVMMANGTGKSWLFARYEYTRHH